MVVVGEEGEFKKRVTGTDSEAVWISRLDSEGKPFGDMLSVEDFLKWIDEAKKEIFGCLEMVHGKDVTLGEFREYAVKDRIELLRKLLKWFGEG